MSGHAAATGNYGHAAATGYSGHAAATGNSGHAAATGDSGHAAATGYSGHAAATGNYGHAFTQVIARSLSDISNLPELCLSIIALLSPEISTVRLLHGSP